MNQKIYLALIGYFFITFLIGGVWIGKKMYTKVMKKIERADKKPKEEEFQSLYSFDSGEIGRFSKMMVYEWSNIENIPEVQDTIRTRFREVLGRTLPYVEDPDMSILAEQTLPDGIRRIVFSVPAEAGYVIKGCMLVPEVQSPVPAIVLAYGLGGTLFQTCGWGIESYHHDMAYGLAKKGFLSISHVLRGLGSDAKDWGQPEWGVMGYRDFVGYTLQHGSSAMNVWVYDSLQVVKAIRKFPQVDPSHVFIGGISHGGQIALYAGALEPEMIKGAIAMGSFVSFQSLYTEVHNWTGHAIPNILSVGNMGDLAALIAPRPLLIQWGEKDSTAPHAQLRPSSMKEFERVKVVYQRMNSLPNLHQVITPGGGHEFEVETAADFLALHSREVSMPSPSSTR